ncbi:transposase [Hymenobacter jeollabukensis]|uniref:Transposase n=1 Tax=Hymenobacter jeollabukensis TaxID=2025313 RepID=A0A5R8WL93_9BACT|nr:transposase [Hymenobacter jeollabukensis]TLM89830.1 transposase [Hymenobacter jeollabukensis]
MSALNLQPHKLYHIYNRGNNREAIFYSPENYRYFLTKLRRYLTPHLRILAWCLMPNHFHLLVQVRERADLPRCSIDLRLLLSSYTRAIQSQYGRTGSLFQQHTKAKELDNNEYALACFCYIHQNPLRAELVREPAQWVWSSYQDYAGLRSGTLCDRAAAIEVLNLPTEAAQIA